MLFREDPAMNMGMNDIVLLVNANQAAAAKLLAITTGVTPPLGLGYIAGYLKASGFAVELLDNDIERLTLPQFKEYVGKIAPRYIGISSLTNSIGNAFALASAAKEVNADIKIIFGGVHASSLPLDVIGHGAVDYVVVGEGEETMRQLLLALNNGRDLGDITGLVYKDSGRIIENSRRAPIADLDGLPFPAYEQLPMGRYYLNSTRRLTNKKMGVILTSRGCFARCSFCSHVFDRKVRFRSPENVVREIRHLITRFGIGEIHVVDDTFTADPARAIAICRLIRKERIDLTWNCNCRVDNASDELYGELYSAGCRELFFGIESGSQDILNSLRKGTTLAQAEEAIKLCKKHKMLAYCSFVAGGEGETERTLDQTLKFAKKLDPDFAVFCMLTPFPGSEIFARAVERGLIDPAKMNWNNYVNLLSTVPPPVNMSALDDEYLLEWMKKAFREFYLNPRYIFRSLRQINSASRVYELARGFCAVAGQQLWRVRTAK